MIVLALDFGRERTGVAISDPTGLVARPLDPVSNANAPAGLASIARLIEDHRVELIVVGLPLRLGGGESTQTRRTRSFAGRLRRHVPVPVQLHDERLTSRGADEIRLETGTTTSRDSLAACSILASYLACRRG